MMTIEETQRLEDTTLGNRIGLSNRIYLGNRIYLYNYKIKSDPNIINDIQRIITMNINYVTSETRGQPNLWDITSAFFLPS